MRKIAIKSHADIVYKYCIDFISVEIQELQAKLKAGYMNRERAAQLAEQRVIELEKKVISTCLSLELLTPVSVI